MIAFQIVLSLYLGAQLVFMIEQIRNSVRERFWISSIAFGIGAALQLGLLIWTWLL